VLRKCAKTSLNQFLADLKAFAVNDVTEGDQIVATVI
jgi:hypothetical protein